VEESVISDYPRSTV